MGRGPYMGVSRSWLLRDEKPEDVNAYFTSLIVSQALISTVTTIYATTMFILLILFFVHESINVSIM